MKSRIGNRHRLLAELYISSRDGLRNFFRSRINNPEDAEDLVQDVFLHLLEYDVMLCAGTVQSLVFVVARNLLNDYLRRYYRRKEADSYLYESLSAISGEAEERLVARDLQRQELYRVSVLPPQRRRIYRMARFGRKSVPDIAAALDLSRRTVENHLFISRKEVREYIRMCI